MEIYPKFGVLGKNLIQRPTGFDCKVEVPLKHICIFIHQLENNRAANASACRRISKEYIKLRGTNNERGQTNCFCVFTANLLLCFGYFGLFLRRLSFAGRSHSVYSIEFGFKQNHSANTTNNPYLLGSNYNDGKQQPSLKPKLTYYNPSPSLTRLAKHLHKGTKSPKMTKISYLSSVSNIRSILSLHTRLFPTDASNPLRKSVEEKRSGHSQQR